jgi:hypothetical protein
LRYGCRHTQWYFWAFQLTVLKLQLHTTPNLDIFVPLRFLLPPLGWRCATWRCLSPSWTTVTMMLSNGCATLAEVASTRLAANVSKRYTKQSPSVPLSSTQCWGWIKMFL